jgi:hypothetical protein
MAILLDTLFDYTDSITAPVQQALDVHFLGASDYMWIVTLSDYWKNRKVTLAVQIFRHYPQKEVHKRHAAILIDDSNPLGYVDLSDMEDRVLPALQGINLIVDEYETLTSTAVNPRINLWIDANHGTREVAFELGGVSDASWIRLRDAVLAMIRDVYPLYHNPVLDAFFAQGIIEG